ncbi:hypothetical protein D9M71_217660 [compost metagenome]
MRMWWLVQISCRRCPSSLTRVRRVKGAVSRSKPTAQSALANASSSAWLTSRPCQSRIRAANGAWRYTTCSGSARALSAQKPVRRISWRSITLFQAATNRSMSRPSTCTAIWLMYSAASPACSVWNSMPCCIGDSG